MKRYVLLFFILCLSTLLRGQSYIDIDFSAEVNYGYAEGVLNIPPDIGWRIDIDNLSEGKGIAKVNQQEAFEIYGIEGSFSLELGALKVDKGKPYLISFDLSNLSLVQDKTEHLEYVGILYENETCLYRISKKVANTSIKIESIMKDNDMMFSIVFDNITENGHYALDNVKIHRFIAPCDKTIPDTTSLISSNCKNINTRFIDDYKKQKIFSFNIEDVDYGSDELSTIITDFRIENRYENQVRLSDLLSNLSVYFNGELVDNSESKVVDNTIFSDFKGIGLEINSNSRNTIDVYADINDSIELTSGVPFSLKLTSDMLSTSREGSQLSLEQEVFSPKIIVMPINRGYSVFSDDYSIDRFRQYSYIDNWIRVENDDKTISNDSLLQANAISSKFNYLSINQGILLFNRQDVSWSIDISNGDWNPSRSNKFCFFLMSDKSEMYDSVSGYAVGVDMDGHDDILCLYRVDNGVFVRIAETSCIWGENARVNLRVVRLRSGDWCISYNDDSSKYIYKETVEYHDETYKTGKYSGMLFRYTSSRSDKLWIDNYNISVLKDEGIVVEQFYLDKEDKLCLIFNESVNTKDILSAKNYSLSSNNVNVEIDNVKGVGNHVEIKADLKPGKYCLTISNLHNNRGELLRIENICFEYIYTVHEGDIVINELMLNPLDGSFEYLELYNMKDIDVDLSDVTYSYNSFVKDTIKGELLPAHGYLLLSSPKGYTSVSTKGQTHVIKSFVLNNESASICLRNRYGAVLDSINYSDEWYDSSMPTKGISLERISVSAPNNGTNWTSSKAESGGTPGEANQTQGDDTIKESAVLIAVEILSPFAIKLVFDKGIDTESLKDWRVFSFNPSNCLPVKDIKLENFRDIIVTFGREMPEGEHCSVEVYGLRDIDGMKIDSSIDFDVPYALKSGDVIINEILLNPFFGGVSFVEIFNNTNSKIDLSHLKVSFTSEYNLPVSLVPISLDAKSYFVLSNNKDGVINYYDSVDETLFADVDKFPKIIESNSVCILDYRDVVIDKLSLDDSFYENSSKEGVSFERVSFYKRTEDRSNWKLATEVNATPTYVNSVLDNSKLLEIKITNQTFRPLSGGDDSNYIVDIENYGDIVWINMSIYNIDAQKIKEVANNIEVSDEVTLKWDGRDESGKIVSTASYMVILEVIHADGTKEFKRFICILCN